VQHGAFEAQLGDGAFEFVGRGLRVGGGERGESRKALGVGRAHFGQTVIDLGGQRGGNVNRKLLGRGGAVRQHLDVDASLVHLLEPQRAQVVKPLVGLVAAAGFGAGVMLGQLRVPIVLFDGDDRTIRLFEHDAPRGVIERDVS